MMNAHGTLKQHLSAVFCVAVLSVVFGGALEYREANSQSVNAPLGADAKAFGLSVSEQWSGLLFKNGDFKK